MLFRSPRDVFYPAPGQGVVTLQARSKDTQAVDLCRLINDEHQERISQLELSLLEQVGFDCNMPLGLWTTMDDVRVSMKGFISDTFFTRFLEIGFDCPIAEVSLEVMNLSQQLIKQFNRWQ